MASATSFTFQKKKVKRVPTNETACDIIFSLVLLFAVYSNKSAQARKDAVMIEATASSKQCTAIVRFPHATSVTKTRKKRKEKKRKETKRKEKKRKWEHTVADTQTNTQTRHWSF